MPSNSKLAEREIRRYQSLLEERRTQNFDTSWQTLANYFQMNLSNINTEKTEGVSGWSDYVYDNTGMECARTCAVGQRNWATPSTEPWFRWMPPKALDLDENDDGSLWCSLCTDIALDELARSNYYTVSGDQYMSRTVFGTGVNFIQLGKDGRLNCKQWKIGSYCIAENDEGIVDTLYVEYKMSARQAAQSFGIDNLPEKIRKASESDSPKAADKKFPILHCIRPREEVEKKAGSSLPEDMAFASIYISMEDRDTIQVSGFQEMPMSVTRFDSWGTDTVWGYSPAFLALPPARQLNYIMRMIDAQLELMINPRILEPVQNTGFINLMPGGRSTYDPSIPGGGKPEEWMTKSNVQASEKFVEMKVQAIKKAFYNDIFTMMEQLNGRMTAYEVSKRVGEKLEQFASSFDRLIGEKTGPELKRIFGLLYRAGKFPQPPTSMFVTNPITGRGELAMPEITYTSRLALALKSMQNRSIEQAMQFLSEFAQSTGRSDIFDNVNLDNMTRRYLINGGVPGDTIRQMKGAIEIRKARDQQQQQAQAMEQARGASEVAKNLGKSPQKMQDAVDE